MTKFITKIYCDDCGEQCEVYVDDGSFCYEYGNECAVFSMLPVYESDCCNCPLVDEFGNELNDRQIETYIEGKSAP